jgi:hypothetical protein
MSPLMLTNRYRGFVELQSEECPVVNEYDSNFLLPPLVLYHRLT